MPAEMTAYTLARLEPVMRTVEVLQFCSWSACRIRNRSIARTMSSSIFVSLTGEENIMFRKFAT